MGNGHNITATTNDSNEGDLSALKASDRGGSTANSHNGDVSSGKEVGKGGTGAEKGSTNTDYK